MSQSSYIIISLKLLKNERVKFSRVYGSFMRMINQNPILQEFNVDRADKPSQVIIKIFPNPKNEKINQDTNLLESGLILRLLSILNQYFLMKPHFISHKGSVKEKKKKTYFNNSFALSKA